MLALTTHGEIAAALSQWQLEAVTYWLREGFVAGPSAALDDVVSDKSYYQNTCHTHDYLRCYG